MIGSAITGRGFGGLIRYAAQDHDAQGRHRDEVEFLPGTMAAQSEEALAREFRAVARLRPNYTRAVKHQMFSLAPGERLSSHQWGALVNRWAKERGFDQYCAWRHYGHGGVEHIHVVANAIKLDGSVVPEGMEYRVNERIVRTLEKEFGLVQVEASHLLEPSPEKRRAPTREEAQLIKQGQPSVRLLLQTLLDDAVKTAPSVSAFVEQLDAAGVQIIPNMATTGKVSGLSFALDGMTFKGSDLGKSFTWNNLLKRGLDYEPARDRPALERCREWAATGRHGDVAPERGRDVDGPVVDPVADRDVGPAVGGPAGVPGRAVGEGHGHAVGGGPRDADHRPVGDRAGQDGQDRERVAGVPGSGESRQGAGGRSVQDGGRNGDVGQRRPPVVAGDQGRDDLRRGVDGAAFRVVGLAQGRDVGAEPAAEGPDGVGTGRVERVADASARRPAAGAGRPGPGAPLTAQVMWEQMAALGCQRFEIGIRSEATDKMMNRKDLTASQVMEKMKWLQRRNCIGEHIYIRPAEDDGLFLLDDLNAEGLARLRKELPPSAVVQTSPGNWQAWVRLSNRPLEKDHHHEVAVLLAKRYGADEAAATQRRYGRLAGFTNPKAKHKTPQAPNGPFSVLDRATAARRVPERAGEALEAATRVMQERASVEEARRREQVIALAEKRGLDRAENRLLSGRQSANDRFITGIVEVQRNSAGRFDWSRADFTVSISMLAEGYKPDEVKSAILTNSASVERRQRQDFEKYAQTTVDKAWNDPRRQQRQDELQRLRDQRLAREAARRFRPDPPGGTGGPGGSGPGIR